MSEQAKALVARWRSLSQGSSSVMDAEEVFDRCAYELEAALSAPAQAGEAVAWQYRVLREEGWGMWQDCSAENAELLREKATFEVRPLFTTPPAPSAADAVSDREADRQRFSDTAFNRWLDEGISDAGHTVWDAVGDVQAAWQGWEARQFAGDAVLLAECCGREECGGECGNDWLGMGMYRKPTPTEDKGGAWPDDGEA